MIVRSARDEDLPAAADLLARAFRDNPLNRALLRGGESHRERANHAGLRATLPVSLRHGEILCASERRELAGVLIAAPPGSFPFPAPPVPKRLRAMWAQGARASQRFASLFEMLCARHPVVPHWYLATLGVEPERQGGGIGSRLLEAWLADVDRRVGTAYLETDRESSRRFYESVGFGVVDSFVFCGVRLWQMQRPSRRRCHTATAERGLHHRWGNAG
ncbi:MAG: GNAT family N-acetyltransferase [Myxococcales bacterium]|nr:GNAT family N-acetyltransferase [Myxococcales bacterium]